MEDKKRVLLVSCGGLGNGGVQAIMMGIVRSLSDRYIFDVLLFTSEVRHYDKEFISYGGEIIRIPCFEGNNRYLRGLDAYIRDFYIYLAAKKALKNRGPYIAIHCNKEFESAPILKVAYDCKIPVRICHNHVVNGKPNAIKRFINKLRLHSIKRYATVKVGCSTESCFSLYGSDDFFVMNNFYDDKRFNPSLYDKRQTDEVVNIVQVGALCSNKNQLFSLHVLSELIKKGVHANLTIVGFELETFYKQRLENEIKNLGISSMVNILPGDTDIPKILNKSQAFLMPSVVEGFGIVLIEAQAMGLYCYASSSVPVFTNCGGVTYIALTEKYSKWADTIIEDLNHIKCTNKQFNTEKFKLSNIVEQYSSIYETK